MSQCGVWSVVATGDDGEVLVHPLACRSWNCPRCRQRNTRLLLRRLGSAKVTTFMTLTTNPAAHACVADSFRSTSKAVNVLFKRIRRKWPAAKVEYFLVWERTKKGWPHAHLLLRAPFIPQRWLSATWKELTGAPIVDIRPANTAGEIGAYLVKYLAKDPYVPAGMKRHRCSRHFFDYLLKDLPAGDRQPRVWSLVKRSAYEVAVELRDSGLVVRCHPDGSVEAWPVGLPGTPREDTLSLHPELPQRAA